MNADRLTSGACAGGPLDGVEVTVRKPDGFLAVDKAAGKAWVYKRQPEGGFGLCLEHDNSLTYPATGERVFDEARAWQAGHDSSIDIIAVSPL